MNRDSHRPKSSKSCRMTSRGSQSSARLLSFCLVASLMSSILLLPWTDASEPSMWTRKRVEEPSFGGLAFPALARRSPSAGGKQMVLARNLFTRLVNNNADLADHKYTLEEAAHHLVSTHFQSLSILFFKNISVCSSSLDKKLSLPPVILRILIRKKKDFVPISY